MTTLAAVVDGTNWPVDRLTALHDLGDAVSATTVETVGAALAEGRTWTEVGGALGISRQAAHQRFKKRLEQLNAPTGSHDSATTSLEHAQVRRCLEPALRPRLWRFAGFTLLVSLRRH